MSLRPTTCARPFAITLALTAILLASPAVAEPLQPLDGWQIHATEHDFATLVEQTEAAIEASPFGLVTQASATAGAARIGETIPGNLVLGVYAPPFAVRMLKASVQAGIEAPMRLYLTENEDGTASLSYRTASFVFAPYDDGGEALDELATEVDAILAEIATAAIAP